MKHFNWTEEFVLWELTWVKLNSYLATIPQPEPSEDKKKDSGEEVYYMKDAAPDLEAEMLRKINGTK